MKPSTFTYPYPRPSLTVDCVIFGLDAKMSLQLLLVRRGGEPYRGHWALPGGFVEVSDDPDNQGEDLEAAARRELQEETGAKIAYLEQLCTFGRPGRDTRGRVISVAYMALVRSTEHAVRGGDDAELAEWIPVASLPKLRANLAFDHAEMIDVAIARLQAKVRYAPIGFNLLPPTFTLGELQKVYEAVLQRPIDKRNFRRRILAMDLLSAVGVQQNVQHRKAAIYKFDRRAYDRAVRDGFNFEV